MNVYRTVFRFALWRVGSALVTLGQKTMANSIPVVLPSDQTVAVSGSVTIPTPVPVTDNASTLSVDDGASSLTIDTDAGAISITGSVDASGSIIDVSGSAVSVTSVGGTVNVSGSTVAISGTVPISAVSLPLPTGAATSANQATANAALSAIQSSVQVMDDWDDADACKVVGSIAHDSADSTSKPVKVGGRAHDYEPSGTGDRRETAVAADDRVNLALTLRGEVPVYFPSKYEEPTNIDTTYNNVTTSATSAAIVTEGYKEFTFGFELTKANTPGDITVDIEADLGSGNWKKIKNWSLGDWRNSSASVGSGGIKECLYFQVIAKQLRVVVTATSTTASNTFTMANSELRCSA